MSLLTLPTPIRTQMRPNHNNPREASKPPKDQPSLNTSSSVALPAPEAGSDASNAGTSTASTPAPAYDEDGYESANDPADLGTDLAASKQPMVRTAATPVEPIHGGPLALPETVPCAESRPIASPRHAAVEGKVPIPIDADSSAPAPLQGVFNADSHTLGASPGQQAKDELSECPTKVFSEPISQDIKESQAEKMALDTSVIDGPPTPAPTPSKSYLPGEVTFEGEVKDPLGGASTHFQVATTYSSSSLAAQSPRSCQSNNTSDDRDIEQSTDIDLRSAADPAAVANPLSLGQALRNGGLSNEMAISMVEGHATAVTLDELKAVSELNGTPVGHVVSVNADDGDGRFRSILPGQQLPPMKLKSELRTIAEKLTEEKPRMGVGSDQSLLPSQIVIGTIVMSRPESMSSPSGVTASKDSASSPTDLATSAADEDIASSMAALAIAPSNVPAPAAKLKRAFDISNPYADTEEEPVTKRQKLVSLESAVVRSTGMDCSAVEPRISEATADGAAGLHKLGDATDPYEPPARSNAGFDSQDEEASALVYGPITEPPMDAQLPIDNSATATTSTSHEETSFNASANAPPLSSGVMMHGDNVAGATWEFGQTPGPVERSVLEEARRRAKQEREAGETTSPPKAVLPGSKGPYVQCKDTDVQEHVTTASPSPPPESFTSPPNLDAEPRGPGWPSMPLESLESSLESAEASVLKPKVNEEEPVHQQAVDEMFEAEVNKSEESDELSDVDEEVIASYSNTADEPVDEVVVKTEDSPGPAHDAHASDGLVAASEFRDDCPTDATVPTAPYRSVLHRELDLGWGRPSTRSQSRSDENASASSSQADDLDTTPILIIKKEVTPASDMATEARATGIAKGLKRHQTPIAATTKKTTPKPEATPKTRATRKPKDAPKAMPNVTSQLTTSSKATSKPFVGSKTRTASRKRTTSNSEPIPNTPKKTTKHNATPKPTPTPNATPEPSAPAPAPSPSPVLSPALGKRKTRHSLALEEERRKAADQIVEKEKNISKRLRSQHTD
ncbi:hypothetical protein SLS59_007353 [Nothophoma quercina]|uniref:Uncharacterized protein n=1 Tax=Nothophoma quercina TaxID=749835 RepID=A0ABR3QZR3_9PLEO